MSASGHTACSRPSRGMDEARDDFLFPDRANDPALRGEGLAAVPRGSRLNEPGHWPVRGRPRQSTAESREPRPPGRWGRRGREAARALRVPPGCSDGWGEAAGRQDDPGSEERNPYVSANKSRSTFLTSYRLTTETQGCTRTSARPGVLHRSARSCCRSSPRTLLLLRQSSRW